MNRIRILFNKNNDRLTREYHVYRSNYPGVDKNSPLVLKARHSASPTPITITNELAERITPNAFKLLYHDVMADQPKQFRLNAAVLGTSEYSLDAPNGIVTVHKEVLDTDKLYGDYTFDGVEIIDDGEKRSVILEYYGPPAQKLLRPTTPDQVVLTIDPSHLSGDLTYLGTTVTPETFYYRICAVNAVGDSSPLSGEQSVQLTEIIGGYQIQYSLDQGKTWLVDGETPDLRYVVTGLDRVAPEAPTVNLVTVAKVDPLVAKVTMNWAMPLLNNLSGPAPLYRVLSKTRAGVLSISTISVGGNTVKTDLDKIIIRRKIFDATYPTFSGKDADTVATITDLTQSQYVDTIQRYIDYGYSVFVVDRAGNHSVAANFTARSVD